MKFWQVDSFTKDIFSGNPAAVFCLLHSSEISEDTMQKIAAEMNLSETVFVWPENGSWGIRWFTPGSEVDLCGHATLAAAHILWDEGFVSSSSVSFLSPRSGKLSAIKQNEILSINFPVQKPIETSFDPLLTKRLSRGAPIVFTGTNNHDAVMVFENEPNVRLYEPDYDAISMLSERGFLITSKSENPRYDYIYRAFFPKLLVPEDPVTGSANTLLAPYWGDVLGKRSLSAFQASKRGGELLLDISLDRVCIGGHAVTVFSGIMHT